MTNRPVISQNIKTFFPGYFALVMATGIISIGSYLLQEFRIAYALFWVTISIYAVLFIIFCWRLVFFYQEVLKDLLDHQKGPTFFTLVAATCIIGNQLVIFFQQILIAKVLLIFSVLSWLVIIYTFFTSITIKKNKPTLDHGISGAWLISIVSAQAISILIVFIAPTTSSIQPVLLFSALGMYLVGCILYIYTMSLIFYRLSFFTLTAIELGAPYWINMGATAITTMAGSMLIINVHQWSFLADTLPFVKGFTLFFWFAGTWWIPLLIILGTWRHLVVKVPLPSSVKGYHPTYWGMVFPLGMYTVSTFRLSEALQLDFLKIIPEYFIYIAYAGWIGVMTGLIRKFVHLLREGGSSVAK